MQNARSIDMQIVSPLGGLPHPVVAETDEPKRPFSNLAWRNLRRGKALGLPAGQDVARAMGIPENLILSSTNCTFPMALGTSGYKLGDKKTADPSVPRSTRPLACS